MKITLADWKCSKKERKYINDVLDSGWLTYGPYCKKLEAMWAKYHNCKYGVVNNSGTSALQLAFRALKEVNGWTNKTEIIVPAITFPATINMVIESGLTPVLVDVELDGMISVKDMQRKVTANTGGVCVVHLWGTPYPRKEELLTLCHNYGLKIVEDSCETISKDVGNWGDVSCFSMYFNHIISAGVGGMACTNDPNLEHIMRSLANHGMIDVHAQPKYKRFNFSRIGYSMRITELEAALGVAQFEKIDSILEKRNNIKEILFTELRRIGMDRMATLIGGTMMFPIVIKDSFFSDSYEFMEYLNDVGIETRTMLPITNQPAFSKYLKCRYPMAERINNFGIFLPIHPRMTKANCYYISNSINTIIKNKCQF